MYVCVCFPFNSPSKVKRSHSGDDCIGKKPRLQSQAPYYLHHALALALCKCNLSINVRRRVLQALTSSPHGKVSLAKHEYTWPEYTKHYYLSSQITHPAPAELNSSTQWVDIIGDQYTLSHPRPALMQRLWWQTFREKSFLSIITNTKTTFAPRPQCQRVGFGSRRKWQVKK